MGAKTSHEMLEALKLIEQMTPYAIVRELAKRGLHITEQAICQRREYRALKKQREHQKPS